MLAVVPALRAWTEQAQTEQSAKEQYNQVLKEYQKLLTDTIKTIQDAQAKGDKAPVPMYPPDATSFAKRRLEIAEKNPKDAVAFDALLWREKLGQSGRHRRQGSH